MLGNKLTLQGKVDAAAEINKLEKKAELTESNKEKLNKTMGLPNYEKNVKEEVRQGNTERVSYVGQRCRGERS
jgi:valyl-tRNA synthetase